MVMVAHKDWIIQFGFEWVEKFYSSLRTKIPGMNGQFPLFPGKDAQGAPFGQFLPSQALFIVYTNTKEKIMWP